MKKSAQWGVIATLAIMVGCHGGTIRKDVFPSPMDTKDHALLIEACGQKKQVVPCSLGFDEEFAHSPIRAFVPASGNLMVYGCGIDSEIMVTSQQSFFFTIPEPIKVGVPGACVVDFTFTPKLPDHWKSKEVIRDLRGRLYFERREKGSAPAGLRAGSDIGIGMVSIKVREGQVLGNESLVVTLTRASAGTFQISGCGRKVTGGFNGNQIEVLLSDLLGGIAPTVGECFLFGWAVGGDGLDETLSVALTVFRKDAQALAGLAWIDKGKTCFEADKAVSFVTLGEQRTNDTKGCFKGTTGVLTFVTAQGRALYGIVSAGGIEWIQ